MASIRHDISINARPDEVWSAVRDFGAVHQRLAPGFVTAVQMDGDARIVTFGNGTVAREVLVDIDDEARRLVYAIVSPRVTHYNASVQVFAEPDDRCRIAWIIDLLPREIAPYVAAQSGEAVPIMKSTLERAASATR
jgi:Polyketide cyclase / dehydrase and lipid transport